MSTATDSGDGQAVFAAVTSSTRQLLQLLKCINFSSKAYVKITKEGLRVSAQEASVVQAVVFLESSLFSSYSFQPGAGTGQDVDEGEDEDIDDPVFMINLDALLETLQIFGINTSADRWADRDYSNRGAQASAFDSHILGINGICRLSYAGEGAPFCVVLEELGVTTTCELNSYEPDNLIAIPFEADAIAHKVITRAEWLLDAIKELSATSPTRLKIVVSPTAPYFVLSAHGAHGSTSVEFNRDPQLLETFQVRRRISNTYKFSMIKGTSRAMTIASKVSIRGDDQGVLSLQFMIEVDDGKVTFVDFRFIPYIAEDDDDDLDQE